MRVNICNKKSVFEYSSAEIGMHWEGYNNTMPADVVEASCVARWSAATGLKIQDKRVIVFHVEWFQLPNKQQFPFPKKRRHYTR